MVVCYTILCSYLSTLGIKKQAVKILVRLPNWLGDMVMSSAFIDALYTVYPTAEISVIAKKGIHGLLDFFPIVHHQFIFSKAEFKGIAGVFKFGKSIKQTGDYDLFFCLPDSFSSAVMAYASGAKNRIGFKKELRSFFLNNSYAKPSGLHRVAQYISLLELYSGQQINTLQLALKNSSLQLKNHLVFNCNSEAESRRLPVEKAQEIIKYLLSNTAATIELIGGPGDTAHVDAIQAGIGFDEIRLINSAGKTTLQNLIKTIGAASAMLTTDSGPAHVGNALGIPVVVLFGAGNENNTAPYNKKNLDIIRLGKLPCEPCVSNTCKFGLPKCLLQLDAAIITAAITRYL